MRALSVVAPVRRGGQACVPNWNGNLKVGATGVSYWQSSRSLAAYSSFFIFPLFHRVHPRNFRKVIHRFIRIPQRGLILFAL